MQNKGTHPEKKSTKSTPAHQTKAIHKKKKNTKSTTVLLKALTMIPDDTIFFSLPKHM